MNPSNFATNDERSCYDMILSNLVRLEFILNGFEHYKVRITAFRVPAEEVEGALQLSRFLAAWVELFNKFSLSPLGAQSGAQSIITSWSNIIKETNLLIAQLDTLIHLVQQVFLCQAQANWLEGIEKIEAALVLISHPIVSNDNKDDDDESTVIVKNIIKFREAAIPCIKLLQIYVKKLWQLINSQPLIFDPPPSIFEKDGRLQSLLNYFKKSDINNYLENLKSVPSRLSIERAIFKTLHLFNQCPEIWNIYLDLLLESDNPAINRDLVIDTGEWLNSWEKLFLVAACN
ncbi:hypothetical protein MJO29_003092 [Puccinia striiformis f. sp. tritici]|nr:hypothetical protein MJO29_003092 [Puccinia striiformis f. sp. tritici]